MLKPSMSNNLFTNKLSCLFNAGICITIVFFSSASFALSSDQNKPVDIEARKVIMKEKQGISHYSGGVKIIQGSRNISGDSITIHSKTEGISKVVIKGKPASFSQLNDEGDTTDASANEMIFYVKKDLLIMKQNAVLKQKDNIFRSEKISYNTAKDEISAGTQDAPDNERVKITIHPKKDKQTP